MCLPQPDKKEQLRRKATIITSPLLIYSTLGVDASERKSEECEIATFLTVISGLDIFKIINY
jgi:hypothetical protein